MNLSFFIFLNYVIFASSFLTKSASFHRRNISQPNRHKNVDNNSMLLAVIMDWNEDSESSSSYAYETQVSEVFHGEERGRAIATKLTESRDKISAFARLAVAFAPSGHAPSISDIEKVEVVLVDEHHLEITASICERDGCATIFVPIPFPKDCGGDDHMEECVLDNLSELDSQAQDLIRDVEKSGGQFELTDEEADERNALYSDDGVAFPSWWVPAGALMEEECKTLKKLLNEDRFKNEVNALARKGLDVMDDGHSFAVLNTAVTVIGPAGFYLRAKTERRNQILDEGTSIVDIPLLFSSGVVAESSPDVRSNALQTLDDAINTA